VPLIDGNFHNKLQKSLNLSLEEATNQALDSFTKLGGSGGLIAVDRFGNISIVLNTEGMYRASF